MRRVSFWLAIAMLGAVSPAAAGSVTLYNCTAGSVTLRAYNSNDAVCWVPGSSAEGFRPCGSSVTLTCAATSCRVQGVPGASPDCGNFPVLVGYRVILKAGGTTSDLEFYACNLVPLGNSCAHAARRRCITTLSSPSPATST
jgi:hypothetical protein